LAVFVEVLVPDRIVGNISWRAGVLPSLVAGIAPLIEVVAVSDAFDIGAQLVDAAEIHGVTSAYRIG
jgi:hypothetical protein